MAKSKSQAAVQSASAFEPADPLKASAATVEPHPADPLKASAATVDYLDDDDEPAPTPLVAAPPVEAQNDEAVVEAEPLIAPEDDPRYIGQPRDTGAGQFDKSVSARAIEALSKAMRAESRTNRSLVRPKLPPMPKEQELSMRPREYRVLELAVIPRGGGEFKLPRGKVINDRDYRIEELRGYGVQLEELEPRAR